jgi:hypothetical protein
MHSWNIKNDKDTVHVYQTDKISMTRDSLVLFGVFAGGDYDQRVSNNAHNMHSSEAASYLVLQLTPHQYPDRASWLWYKNSPCVGKAWLR